MTFQIPTFVYMFFGGAIPKLSTQHMVVAGLLAVNTWFEVFQDTNVQTQNWLILAFGHHDLSWSYWHVWEIIVTGHPPRE